MELKKSIYAKKSCSTNLHCKVNLRKKDREILRPYPVKCEKAQKKRNNSVQNKCEHCKKREGVNLKIPLIFLLLFLSDNVANTLSSSRAQFGGWTRNTIHSSYAKRVTQILLPLDVSDTFFLPFFGKPLSLHPTRAIRRGIFFSKSGKTPFPLFPYNAKVH